MLYCLHTRRSRTSVSSLLVLILLLANGCAKRPSDSETQQKPQVSSVSKPVAVVTRSPTNSDNSVTPEEMPSGELEFSKRYRQADSYSDVALLTLSRLLDDGRIQKTETTVETLFSKPHRIQLRVTSEDNSVIIVSDGKHIATRIIDPVTENFHGQMVFRKMGEKLSFADLYQVTELVDPLAPNEMLSALLAVPAGLDVLPLSILLEEGKLAELAGPKSTHAKLGQMELPTGEHCDVVQIESSEGKYRLWIDDQALRRIEMPPLSRDLMPGVKQLSLSIDLSKVSFTVADSDFHIDQGGTKVRHFVLPPIPPMTERLGEQIPPLRFLNENRQEVRVANDETQTTVLVWYGDHPESRMVLQAIEQVRRRNRSDRVRLAAVAADSSVTRRLLEQWEVETAWLEDRTAQGRDALGIQRSPTVVVLGPKNRLDYFEVGANPHIGADVAVVLERLLAGQNVAESTKTLFRETRTSYDRILARAKLDGDGWIETPDADLPEASSPQKLDLTELWSSDEVKEPGNFLIVPGKQKQLLVLDGWNRIALMNFEGKLKRAIQLELPENEGVSILRAGSNGRDRALIAATSRGGRQAFVFDFAGKQVAQYPPAANEQVSISDVMVHAIANDGEPELIVGLQGDGGIEGVGLDGKHHWSNQATTGVISITGVHDPSARERRRPVLTTSGSGRLFLVDENGRTLREVRLEQAVHQCASWPGTARGFEAILHRDRTLAAGHAVYLGIASSSFGGRVLTGIDGQWKAIWSYTMPQGIYRHQVDFPQAISIPEIGPMWLVPGPDGSVHFLSADGKFQDQMYVGSHIRGIAGTTIDQQSVLLVATDGRITAHQITRASSD